MKRLRGFLFACVFGFLVLSSALSKAEDKTKSFTSKFIFYVNKDAKVYSLGENDEWIYMKNQEGKRVRTYETPILKPGKTYKYNFKVVSGLRTLKIHVSFKADEVITYHLSDEDD